ncbi:DUF4249 domain-containing protein [Flavobacteriaceae bacterium TP-CH-4]|uniref:DUF4249 domain-containing protein n=1 Tax=Pelagihabitans pacificus TaxID=2696054 RepID=A0A967E737_9FLAO|nr:DUF4249 domain-containing protein [Pelagihabitans pacificus]NHF59824.1 DUF4249 domain-containing protein [Pelagihabitans pacificus]
MLVLKSKKTYLLFLPIVVGFLLAGCIEPFNATTEKFEDVLVVDALLTDEMKRQKVVLQRAFRFEETDPQGETNAIVKVVDGNGNAYDYEETDPGVYLSQTEFAAQQNDSYELEINTFDGRTYRSITVGTPRQVPITDLTAKRMVDDSGEEGVGILLDNEASSSEPTFFRYEYDETYKIIAPRWDPFEFEIVHYVACDTIPYQVDIKPRTQEQRVCFGNAASRKLIQVTTTDLTKSQVDDFQVHFLNRDNYIISHRYSIEVRQYSQTPDAYSFYQRLDDFSSSDNIFSQVQPGFFQGNVFSVDDENEKVLGFFEVASVSSQRLYFNYADLFPEEPLPPYAINCETPRSPPLYGRAYHCLDYLVCDGNCDSPLIEAIIAGLITYAGVNENPGIDMGPYFTWPSPCGDCTKLGSNVVPDFWAEE